MAGRMNIHFAFSPELRSLVAMTAPKKLQALAAPFSKSPLVRTRDGDSPTSHHRQVRGFTSDRGRPSYTRAQLLEALARVRVLQLAGAVALAAIRRWRRHPLDGGGQALQQDGLLGGGRRPGAERHQVLVGAPRGRVGHLDFRGARMPQNTSTCPSA